jgi:hypothetical protein
MVGVDYRGWGDRSALESVEPSIAPSTITNIKTTEFPLVLRAQGISGTSLSALGIAAILWFLW